MSGKIRIVKLYKRIICAFLMIMGLVSEARSQTNLLQNASFEISTSVISPWNCTGLVGMHTTSPCDYGSTPDGNNFVQTTGTLWQNTGTLLESGRTYLLTFKASSLDATMLYVDFFGADDTTSMGAVLASYSQVPSLRWIDCPGVSFGDRYFSTYTFEYTHPSTAAAKYLVIGVHQEVSGAWVGYDSFILVAEPSKLPSNFLQNPSFEASATSIAPWSYTNAMAIHTASSSYYGSAPGGTNFIQTNGMIWQNTGILMQTGRSYKLAFWASSWNASTIKVTFRGSNDAWNIGLAELSTQSCDAHIRWTDKQSVSHCFSPYSFTYTHNGPPLYMTICVSHNPTNSWACYDNFMLSRIEPWETQVTRGHRILIQKGLQLPAFWNPGFNVSLLTLKEANFTTPDFGENILTGDGLPCISNTLGPPSAMNSMWIRWAREIKDPNDSTLPNSDPLIRDSLKTLQYYELPYLPKMVAMQFYDDDLVNYFTRYEELNYWFTKWHAMYPDVLTYFDHSGFKSDDLAPTIDYAVTRARPDMMMFNGYYFDGADTDGSPKAFYERLRRTRAVALAGLDGNGNQPIPYGVYAQMCTGYWLNNHVITESEVRLNYFVPLAMGYKFIEAFIYNDPDWSSNIISVLFDGKGDDSYPGTTRKPLFNTIAAMNREIGNLGPTLVRLLSTDIRIVMGQHKNESGLAVSNDLPACMTTNLDGADPYLTSITVANLGSKNNSLPGDVLIGFFKPLHESFDGETYSNQKYFMITNGLSAVDGSAVDCRQRIRVNFNFGSSGITSLQRIRRSDGQVEMVTLVHDSGTLYHLDLELDGGTGDLFKYNTGATFITGLNNNSLLAGDANGDGMVDVGDLGILAANYGGSGKSWSQGDFNGDGLVDVGDLGILAAHYGQGTANPASADFSSDYAKIFSTTAESNDENIESLDDEENADTLCSGLGLPMITGMILMGLMLLKSQD